MYGIKRDVYCNYNYALPIYPVSTFQVLSSATCIHTWLENNKTHEELLPIATELLSKNKDSNAVKFIINTGEKVTLFAELATKGIRISNNNNHVENLMGIVGQKVKKNRQSWVDANLNIMLSTIWHIIS